MVRCARRRRCAVEIVLPMRAQLFCHLMRIKRAAFAHVSAPPTRASNFSKTQNPALYGSDCIVTAFLVTSV
jgi:hypothetical protein